VVSKFGRQNLWDEINGEIKLGKLSSPVLVVNRMFDNGCFLKYILLKMHQNNIF
jgi:hypothetical protein